MPDELAARRAQRAAQGYRQLAPWGDQLAIVPTPDATPAEPDQPRDYMPAAVREALGRTERPPALGIRCPLPRCGAPPGAPCRTLGRTLTRPHPARVDAAAELAPPAPADDT